MAGDNAKAADRPTLEQFTEALIKGEVLFRCCVGDIYTCWQEGTDMREYVARAYAALYPEVKSE